MKLLQCWWRSFFKCQHKVLKCPFAQISLVLFSARYKCIYVNWGCARAALTTVVPISSLPKLLGRKSLGLLVWVAVVTMLLFDIFSTVSQFSSWDGVACTMLPKCFKLSQVWTKFMIFWEMNCFGKMNMIEQYIHTISFDTLSRGRLTC